MTLATHWTPGFRVVIIPLQKTIVRMRYKSIENVPMCRDSRGENGGKSSQHKQDTLSIHRLVRLGIQAHLPGIPGGTTI